MVMKKARQITDRSGWCMRAEWEVECRCDERIVYGLRWGISFTDFSQKHFIHWPSRFSLNPFFSAVMLSPSFFYKYYFIFCSREFFVCTPPPLIRSGSTKQATASHILCKRWQLVGLLIRCLLRSLHRWYPFFCSDSYKSSCFPR